MTNVSAIIKLSSIKQFELAFSTYRILFFGAPCGCGQTATLKEVLKNEAAHFRSAAEADCLDFDAHPLSEKCHVFVLDDFQYMTEPKNQDKLCGLIRTRADMKFILLSRGSVPGWLLPFQYTGLMENFNINFFTLDRAAVQKMLAENNVEASSPELAAICRDCKGYGIVHSIVCRLKQNGEAYSPAMRDATKRELFVYMAEAVYRRFDIPLRQLLTSIAPFETFTIEMAKIVSGNSHAGELVAILLRDTNMMTFDNVNTYRSYEIFREFLVWQTSQEYTMEEQRALFNHAGLYYEIHDDIVNALKCYSEGKDNHKVSELLVKQAELHPGVGHYYELEPYYLELPEEQILHSPALMCGMSMLCALLVDFEESERWYENLQNYAVHLKRTDSQYKDARSKLAYLDIALPQRGSSGMVELIGNLFKMLINSEVKLWPFSVTSTLPSIMNGGKDFCNWSKKDDFIYKTMGTTIETVLGKDGVCLADTAICESKFEKGEDVSERLLNLVSRLGEVQNKGATDIEFAIVGLLARNRVAQGRVQAAKDTIENLRSKFAEMDETRFLPNMDAMLCRMALHVGDYEWVDEWYEEKAPQDILHLRAMWRYQYITRAMVEMTRSEYERAMLVLAPLLHYCEKCYRTMDSIYIHLLFAICFADYGHTALETFYEETNAENY